MVARRGASYSFFNVLDTIPPISNKHTVSLDAHGMKRSRSTSSAGLLEDDDTHSTDNNTSRTNSHSTPRFSLPSINTSWPSLKGQSGYTYNHTLAVQELRRVSLYRMQAHDMDLLRPFLLLASMPPVRRQLCASHLHLDNTLKECGGDAHAEAWCILAHKRNGIVPRTAKTAGINLNMSGTMEHEVEDSDIDFSWFEIMDTVAKNAAEDHSEFYHKRCIDETNENSDAESQSNKDEHGKSRAKLQDRLKRCEESTVVDKQAAIKNLEELLIIAVLAIGSRVIDEAIPQKLTNCAADDERWAVLEQRFKKAGHFSNQLVIKSMIGESYLTDEDRIRIVKSLGGFWLKRKEERYRDVSRLGVDALLIQMSPATQSPLGNFFSESVLRSMVFKQKAAEPFPVIVALCMQRAFLAQGDLDIDRFCY